MGDKYLEFAREAAAKSDGVVDDEAAQQADYQLIMRLLAGCELDERGLVSTETSYLKSNSREERQARAALARQVRVKMRGFTGELLALAIDPHTKSDYFGMRPTRRIKFESPARGKSSTWLRDLLVAHFIKRQMGNRSPVKLEAVIVEAMDRFKIGRSLAIGIWTKHKKLLGRGVTK